MWPSLTIKKFDWLNFIYCRFWDRGYWKNFLGNRKYHISALYRVDLKRFRQLAAGDRLRGQYQALSQVWCGVCVGVCACVCVCRCVCACVCVCGSHTIHCPPPFLSPLLSPLLPLQDPNSLANLDQDLPNNMIHSVPIYSLPQEWLWCETWCSNETKEHAKTIDLVRGWNGEDNKTNCTCVKSGRTSEEDGYFDIP